MSNRPLGRRVPSDFRHYERFPLTAETTPDKPVPVVLGVNWYDNFDRPEKDSNGRYWIGRSTSLGSVRGGHCVCLEPGDPSTGTTEQDTNGWWDFYDQGQEGACVGFGSSRMMSLLNRKRYFARWLWDQAKVIDEWPETKPGDDNGTSVRAAFEVLRTRGHVPWKASYQPMNDSPGDAYARSGLRGVEADGVSAYRWAKTTDEVMAALKSPAAQRMGAVRVLNSWGSGWPHRVWLPLEVVQRLIDEDGEAGIAVDR
jgi:hypothetical protein